MACRDERLDPSDRSTETVSGLRSARRDIRIHKELIHKIDVRQAKTRRLFQVSRLILVSRIFLDWSRLIFY